MQTTARLNGVLYHLDSICLCHYQPPEVIIFSMRMDRRVYLQKANSTQGLRENVVAKDINSKYSFES